MSEPWALVASAADIDDTAREKVSREFQSWLSGGGEGVSLVTCHRVELYGVGAMPALPRLERLEGEGAITHLLRVACGLESVIVGEDEVLHQVRKAFSAARGQRPVEARLHRLFETAIATGRRARSRRTESSGNLAQRAVAWLQSKANVSGEMVLVAGAGRMGAVLAHSLAAAGAEVVVSSRDPRRATRLARSYASTGVGLQAGAELVGRAAAVAVALGGPWTELEAVDEDRIPPIADISAPQAVPAGVRRRLNGDFLGIDDLYRESHPLPGAYIEDAKRLVAGAASGYTAWAERPR